ncbi:MAG: rod shape-determining protein RodA [Nannocystaceae bacterium]|nr:rod shape-determining protein RodA [Nannocystaceae bacterium]
MNELLDGPRDLWGRIRRDVDWVVVTLALAIVALAAMNLNSAGAGDWTGRVQAQLRWVGLGTVVMFVVAAIDYRVMYKTAYAAYALGVGLLALVPLLGIKVNNARRWLGTEDYRLQPSENMKVIMVVAIARFLHDAAAKSPRKGRQLLIPAAMVLLPVAFIVKQPDLGTGIMLLIIAFSVMSVAGLRIRTILAVVGSGLPSFVLAWRYLQGYQRRRIDVWLDPQQYADKEGYQTIQAMISVGNGGIFGRGVDQGTQNVLGFMPEPFTDFPFAVYAEEWGFVGATMVMALYMCLVLWAVNIASQAKDRFGALLCAGVASLFFWHVVVNIGMVLQLVPVSGITLPWFSAGGSNVLTMMIALGILMSVSRSRQYRR